MPTAYSNINDLITSINDRIRQNGNEEITGEVHQEVLHDIVLSMALWVSETPAPVVNQFESWNPETTYEAGIETIVKHASKLWLFVKVTNSLGQEPGTNSLVWREVSALSLAHFRNRDQALDAGGPYYVTAQQVYELLQNGGASALALVLGVNNHTGAHDIIIDDGRALVFTDGSHTQTIKAASLSATGILLLPSKAGTHTLATTSDVSTAIAGLGSMASQNAGAVAITGGSMSGVAVQVASPVSGPDAANKSYVDALVAGISGTKLPVRVAATSNVNLSSMPASVDGVTLSNGDRFLAPAQTTGSQNGPYVFNGAGVAATRPVDYDTWDEILSTLVIVLAGSTHDNAIFQCVSNPGGTLGSSTITYIKLKVDMPVPVPVNHGGTGSTTPAGARANLELGSFATLFWNNTLSDRWSQVHSFTNGQVLAMGGGGGWVLADQGTIGTSTVLGIVTNVFGGLEFHIVTRGAAKVTGAAYTPGTRYFLGAAGAMTTTPPAGNLVPLGVAISSDTILFSPALIPAFGSLADVIIGSPSTGDVWTFDGTSWGPEAPTGGGGGGPHALGSHTDVDISSPAAGDRLMWDGTKWVNVPRLRHVAQEIHAVGMRPTDGAAPIPAGGAIGSFSTDTLAFTNAATRSADLILLPPPGYTGGQPKVRFTWRNPSGSGTVRWFVRMGWLANDDAINVSLLNSAVNVDDTSLGNSDFMLSDPSAAITPAGTYVAGRSLMLRVGRDHTTGTLAADAHLLSVMIQWPCYEGDTAW